MRLTYPDSEACYVPGQTENRADAALWSCASAFQDPRSCWHAGMMAMLFPRRGELGAEQSTASTSASGGAPSPGTLERWNAGTLEFETLNLRP